MAIAKHIQNHLEWIENAYKFITEEIPEAAGKFWESVKDAWNDAKHSVEEIAQNVDDFFSGMSEAASDWWDKHFGKEDQDTTSNRTHRSASIRVNTQQLQDASTHLANMSHTLEELASAIGRHARSIQRMSFAGTAVLRASLTGAKLQTSNLSKDAEDLACVLTRIAEMYDQAEMQIRNYPQN